jgi:hypothetical protein
MEKRRAVLISALGLTVGALSFWITLSLVDYGFWAFSTQSFLSYQDARIKLTKRASLLA